MQTIAVLILNGEFDLGEVKIIRRGDGLEETINRIRIMSSPMMLIIFRLVSVRKIYKFIFLSKVLRSVSNQIGRNLRWVVWVLASEICGSGNRSSGKNGDIPLGVSSQSDDLQHLSVFEPVVPIPTGKEVSKIIERS